MAENKFTVLDLIDRNLKEHDSLDLRCGAGVKIDSKEYL
jgi:hypothetical protein